jgi:SAM-dependent methyltransferase
MDPLFFELHSGLAHEAPGSRADTLRALALTGRSGPLRVLDAGSGPGAASLTLLDALPEAEVIALDLHAPFLADTQARADAAGLGARLRTHAGDMAEPPFAPASLDLIWSEGAANSIGVPRALDAWKPLLGPGGRIAFSDAVWTVPDPHPRARAVFGDYPAMTDMDGVRAWIATAGLRPIADFLVSDQAWANYYGPLAERLERLAAIHGAAHPVLAEAAEEIAVRRDHATDYGYGFFVVA